MGGRDRELNRRRLRYERKVVGKRVNSLLVGEEDVVVGVPKGEGGRSQGEASVPESCVV